MLLNYSKTTVVYRFAIQQYTFLVAISVPYMQVSTALCVAKEYSRPLPFAYSYFMLHHYLLSTGLIEFMYVLNVLAND